MLARLAEHPQFCERFNRSTRPAAWESYVYLLADDTGVQLSSWAQIRFPNDQLDELTRVLSELPPPDDAVRSNHLIGAVLGP